MKKSKKNISPFEQIFLNYISEGYTSNNTTKPVEINLQTTPQKEIPITDNSVAIVLKLIEKSPNNKKGDKIESLEERNKIEIDDIQIKSINDYALQHKNEQDLIFIRRLEESGRIADKVCTTLPDMRDVLMYLNKIPNQPLWFNASIQSITNTLNVTYPEMDVLTRDFIIQHLRSPLNGEVSCQNNVCESERLGGFRLKVLTLKNNTWCYLCHLFHTNKLYLESLNRKQDNDRVFQIHYFMVQVNIIGEYRLDNTLMGEKDVRGLFGPFPIYNVHNYTKTRLSNGCFAWIESDSMVFRLSQTTSSKQIESCGTIQQGTGNIFTLSSHTNSFNLHSKSH